MFDHLFLCMFVSSLYKWLMFLKRERNEILETCANFQKVENEAGNINLRISVCSLRTSDKSTYLSFGALSCLRL